MLYHHFDLQDSLKNVFDEYFEKMNILSFFRCFC